MAPARRRRNRAHLFEHPEPLVVSGDHVRHLATGPGLKQGRGDGRPRRVRILPSELLRQPLEVLEEPRVLAPLADKGHVVGEERPPQDDRVSKGFAEEPAVDIPSPHEPAVRFPEVGDAGDLREHRLRRIARLDCPKNPLLGAGQPFARPIAVGSLNLLDRGRSALDAQLAIDRHERHGQDDAADHRPKPFGPRAEDHEIVEVDQVHGSPSTRASPHH